MLSSRMKLGTCPSAPFFLLVLLELLCRGVSLSSPLRVSSTASQRATALVTRGAGRVPRVQWVPRAGTGLRSPSLLRHSAYRLLTPGGRTRRPGDRPSSTETKQDTSPAQQALKEYLENRSCHQAPRLFFYLATCPAPCGCGESGEPPRPPRPSACGLCVCFPCGARAFCRPVAGAAAPPPRTGRDCAPLPPSTSSNR